MNADDLPPEEFCHVLSPDGLGRPKGCGSEPAFKVTLILGAGAVGVAPTIYACERHSKALQSCTVQSFAIEPMNEETKEHERRVLFSTGT